MEQIIRRFELDGEVVSQEAYGHGHINSTVRLVTDKGTGYILQRINHHVFRDVAGLMNNVQLVTEHLRAIDPDPRHSLQLIPTKDGALYTGSDEEGWWRVYLLIANSVSLDQPETLEDFRQSAVAFGTFQQQLSDFPAEKLCESIPHFHDTPDRYRIFRESVAADRAGRVASAKEEIAFVLAREKHAARNTSLQEAGLLPLRVTHNDTKLNNVLLDAVTREPLCVIDLDTVMPGLACNDFGDAIRFGASTACEDEADLSKIRFSMERYAAYLDGYLSACGDSLTEEELRSLPWGAYLMTLEVGLRFLTDHLDGDVYFHTAYPEHNLVRARNQFALLRDMEAQWDAITALTDGKR